MIDFDADGIRHMTVGIPYSRDDSAWGSVGIPVTLIKNGSGPTVVLSGGVHGDEFEGPIVLSRLCRDWLTYRAASLFCRF
jgi:N-alpha-acetyl-L-2,4-diaminobutyrate deacetylase